MKISHSWLSDFIDLDTPVEEIAEVLTQTGLEIESIETIEKIPGGLRGLVVGEVLECGIHPNAEKLKITSVDIGGDSPYQIVCGAPNVAKGQKVIVAPINSTVHPNSGEPFKIKKAKIRGELSEGMICAEDEIGLGQDHDGILVLDTTAVNGTPAIDLFDVGNETVYEIGLTPNRGDAASHLGTARDLGAFYKKGLTSYEIGSFDVRMDDPIKVSVENSEACPRYSGVTIRGIEVKTSPDWLKNRLQSIGLAPINNVVDITNYILHGLGQPLHAFDGDQIQGNHVIVKTVPKNTEFRTLDDKLLKLDDHDLMICNEVEGMCIAGVFGGVKSGITEQSKSVFLESAYFDANWVRASAQRHGLSTDASFRYERGTDPEMTLFALKYATQLILELAGGYIASDFIDIYPNPIPKKKVITDYEYFDWIIGKKIPQEEIKSILHHLDIEVKEIGDSAIEATVPSYRSEVTRPADLVEEVLRIHGINNIDIDESFSTDYLAEFEEKEPYKIQEEASLFLAGKGYHEIVTNSLTNVVNDEKVGLGSEKVEIINKSSEELAIMKTSPLHTSLEVLRHNINRKMVSLRLFEFPRTYIATGGKYKETEWLSLYLTGKDEESWMNKSKAMTFHDLSLVVQGLLISFNIDRTSNKEIQNDPIFSYGLSINWNNIEIGKFGEIKNGITTAFDIHQTVFFCQMNWQYFLKAASKKIEFRALSKFPEVRRDLSLILDKEVTFSQIEEIAFKSEKKLLTRVNVFSLYEGDSIGEDKKAYAVSFHLQDTNKTLNDKQIDKVMNNLISQFERNIGAIIRK